MPNFTVSVYGQLLDSIIQAHTQGKALLINCPQSEELLLKRGLILAKHKLKAKGDTAYANHAIRLEHHSVGTVRCSLELKEFAKPKPTAPTLEDM